MKKLLRLCCFLKSSSSEGEEVEAEAKSNSSPDANDFVIIEPLNPASDPLVDAIKLSEPVNLTSEIDFDNLEILPQNLHPGQALTMKTLVKGFSPRPSKRRKNKKRASKLKENPSPSPENSNSKIKDSKTTFSPPPLDAKPLKGILKSAKGK